MHRLAAQKNLGYCLLVNFGLVLPAYKEMSECPLFHPHGLSCQHRDMQFCFLMSRKQFMCVNGMSLFYFGEQVQNQFEVASVSTVWEYAVQI